jgi:hypothetical protein
MPDPTVVNIPIAHFEEIAAAPLRLAQAEAAEMLRRGDAAGANARIAEGVAKSAAMRAQVLATQQAAPPPPPAAPQQTAPPPPVDPRAHLDARFGHLTPFQRGLMPSELRAAAVLDARLAAGGNPMRDPSLPFALTSRPRR